MVKWKPTTLSVHHMSYIWSFCLFSLILLFLEPACKKSCQPIADKLTDIQATKSTAEQPQNPTVPTQPLGAEHSASPSLSSRDIHHHITEPFQPTNFTFPKKTFGKQNRSFQANRFTEFPWLHYNEQSDSVMCFICIQQNEKLNLRAARNKDWVFIRTDFPAGTRLWYDSRDINFLSVTSCHGVSNKIPNSWGNIIQISNDAAKKLWRLTGYAVCSKL